MIYVTGDTHGDIRRLGRRSFPDSTRLTKDDFLIICGDFGLIWDYHGETVEEKHWLDWLDSKPFTALFIDGNHENFDRLNALPIEIWNGGKIHQIRPSVLHLMRGQVFNLPFESATKRIFTFGGAKSHDITDGVLDPEKDNHCIREWNQYNRNGHWPFKMFRIYGQSWWPQEFPSDTEMKEGIENLEEVGWNVDYIFTHDCSTPIKYALDFNKQTDIDELNSYLGMIQRKTTYDKWFFGHYHCDKWIADDERLIFEDIIPVSSNNSEREVSNGQQIHKPIH